MVTFIDKQGRILTVSVADVLFGRGDAIRKAKRNSLSKAPKNEATKDEEQAMPPAEVPPDVALAEDAAPVAETAPDLTESDDHQLMQMKSHDDGEGADADKGEGELGEGEVERTNDGPEEVASDEGSRKPRSDSNDGGRKRPVIIFDDGEELDLRQMLYLYRLHEFYESKKWIEISSKFFDRTGKRIRPEELMRTLGDVKWSEAL